VVAEQADVADLGALRGIGARHQITGIVHLAGYPGFEPEYDTARVAADYIAWLRAGNAR
jgi:UDP-glucose 4-epimerase